MFFPGASLPCCLSTRAPALWNVKGPGSGRTPWKEADTPVTRTPAPRRPSLLPSPSPITRSFSRACLVGCIPPCVSWPLDLATSSGTWSRRVVPVVPGEQTMSVVGSSACSRLSPSAGPGEGPRTTVLFAITEPFVRLLHFFAPSLTREMKC